MSTAVCNVLPKSVAEAVRHCTKSVLSTAVNLLANPGLQFFNILQSMRAHFSVEIPPQKKEWSCQIRRPWRPENIPRLGDKAS